MKTKNLVNLQKNGCCITKKTAVFGQVRFGEFTALSDKQFYDLVFGYYPKLYEKDDFMGEMKYLFTDEAKK